MTHLPPARFEAQLAAALNTFAERAPTDLDTGELLDLVENGTQRSRWVPRHGVLPRLPRLATIAILLALATALVSVIAGMVQQRPAPWPYRGVLVPAPGLLEPRATPVAVALANSWILVLGGGAGTHATGELLLEPRGRPEPVGPLVDADGLAITSAAALPGGHALLVGEVGSGSLRRPLLQVFDAETRTFSEVGPMVTPRLGATATALRDGRVLISGGVAMDPSGAVLAAAEIYDPRTRSFGGTGDLAVPRVRHTMVALADGRILVLGGEQGDATFRAPLRSLELFDPGRGSFRLARASLPAPLVTAVRLPDGRVAAILDAAEPLVAWDPASGTVAALATPTFPPERAIALDDGRLLLMATHGDGLRTRAGLYQPADGTTRSLDGVRGWLPLPVRLADGRIALVGGRRDGHMHVGADGSVALGSPVDFVQVLE